jgi:hypothetical protein
MGTIYRRPPALRIEIFVTQVRFTYVYSILFPRRECSSSP